MKHLILWSLSMTALFLNGCSELKMDDEKRILGIIDSAYTKYENTKDMKSVEVYLEKKENGKEISKTTSYTIINCIKRSDKDLKNER